MKISSIKKIIKNGFDSGDHGFILVNPTPNERFLMNGFLPEGPHCYTLGEFVKFYMRKCSESRCFFAKMHQSACSELTIKNTWNFLRSLWEDDGNEPWDGKWENNLHENVFVNYDGLRDFKILSQDFVDPFDSTLKKPRKDATFYAPFPNISAFDYHEKTVWIPENTISIKSQHRAVKLFISIKERMVESK